MKTVNINDGVVTYTATVPDEWDAPPNFHHLKQSFANGYDAGDCDNCTPFNCIISGDFEGSFLLHCNGRGGTIEADDPWVPVPAIKWVG
jgi:hypothetical protein